MALSTIVTLVSLITLMRCDDFQNFASVCGSDVFLSTNSSGTYKTSVTIVSQCVMECAFSEESDCYGFNVFQDNFGLHCQYLYKDDYLPTCDDAITADQSRIYIKRTTKTCKDTLCKVNEKCVDTLQGPKCRNNITECDGPPPTIPYSTLLGNTSNFTIGTSLVYLCDDDYFMIGGEITICSENGTWLAENGGLQKGCSVLVNGQCSGDLDCSSVVNSHCESGLCRCRNGFYFVPSQELCASDCKSLKEAYGYINNGNYTIYPDGVTPLRVECDMDNGRLVIWAKRTNASSYDFRKPWEEYLFPFGTADGDNYWIGLYNLHWLTLKSTSVYFDLYFQNVFKTSTVAWIYYGDFIVGNISSMFRMTIDDQPAYSEEMAWLLSNETGLAYHNGMSFSTYDVDNDMWANGSVAETHGAWWMKDENYTFGDFFGRSDQSIIFNYNLTQYPLKAIVFKIIRDD